MIYQYLITTQGRRETELNENTQQAATNVDETEQEHQCDDPIAAWMQDLHDEPLERCDDGWCWYAC